MSRLPNGEDVRTITLRIVLQGKVYGVQFVVPKAVLFVVLLIVLDTLELNEVALRWLGVLLRQGIGYVTQAI